MLKIICFSLATGVVAVSAASPVVTAHSGMLGEPATMLIAAMAFFGLASVIGPQGKGPRR